MATRKFLHYIWGSYCISLEEFWSFWKKKYLKNCGHELNPSGRIWRSLGEDELRAERQVSSQGWALETPAGAAIEMEEQDFPGGTVDRNPPANAGDRDSILVQEDSTCLGATKPLPHNYWARLLQLLKSKRLEPMFCNKRSLRNEKPIHHN